MNNFFTRPWSWHNIEISLWCLIWFSLPISLKLTSAGVILLSVTTFLGLVCKKQVPARSTWRAIMPFLLFFFWQLRELTTSRLWYPVWLETEQNLSLLVIPLIYHLSSINRQKLVKLSVNALGLGLLLCSLVILPAAVARYVQTGDPDEFVYHKLAGPIHTGAIYFSLYLLFVLVMAGEAGWRFFNSVSGVLKLTLFVALLLLMASKLLIITGLTLLIFQYRQQLMQCWRESKVWFFVALGVLAVGSIPLLTRLNPLFDPNPRMAFSENFKDCPEPNGLQLRLIFWRFGLEILHEQQAWLTGAGMAGAQPLLDEKIIGHGMYLGTGIGTDTGYLHYNFHNQFLETLVRQGIPGLLLLIWIILIPFFKSANGPKSYWLFWLIILGLFMTESVLERQAGMIFFCLVHVNRPLKSPD